MRVFLMLLVMSSAVLLSACNGDDEDVSSGQPMPPKPNCKMHCAP